MPSFGLGTWKAKLGVVGNSITTAIQVGYRHIDCAPFYYNEKEGFAPLGSPSSTAAIKNEVLKNPILLTVAEKLGRTSAQVALRWGVQMGHSVLPKSTNEARIKENLDVFDWSIHEDLFAKLSEIKQERLIRGTVYAHETFGAYKTIEEL